VAAVAAVVAANLWDLRANLKPISYLNDAAVAEQMVRTATRLFSSGRDPLATWYPYLNVGSPQFLHYQSLGAMTTGALGLVVGPDHAFRLALWLLLGTWPLAIYLAARMFRLGQWPSVAAAAVSPLLGSVPQVGTEHDAYVWVGYGLWAQLWGTWFLPLAWAATWRAMEDRRWILPAGLLVAVTVTLHYETGYLALLAVVAFPWLRRAGLRQRVGRALGVAAVTGLLAAWTIIPLLVFSRWAAINQALVGTPLENGYGAGRVLSWLFTGGVFDGTKGVAVTAAALTGFAACTIGWRRQDAARPILVIGLASMILCFGRTTFGALADVVPASHDVFFRRFMLGLQVAGVLAVAVAVAEIPRWAEAVAGRWRALHPASARQAAAAICGVGLAAVLVAAVPPVSRLDRRNAEAIDEQRAAAAGPASLITPLVDYIRARPDGRVYAGSPDNFGANFTVGYVQVYKYLASLDLDVVGFTLRTASLMSQPEYHFDDTNPSDYAIFAVRYLLLPATMAPPVAATEVQASGPYRLWVVPGVSYFDTAETVGTIRADRADVGPVTAAYLRSGLFAQHQALSVGWAGATPPAPTEPQPVAAAAGAAPGRVVSAQVRLAVGRADAVVDMDGPGIVTLSASFDPGWTARVNGRPAPVQMLAPAIVGVEVPAGTSRVELVYRGFNWYPWLFGLVAIGLLAGGAIGGWIRWPRTPATGKRPRDRQPAGDPGPAGVVAEAGAASAPDGGTNLGGEGG
jgi:hypothetical protein